MLQMQERENLKNEIAYAKEQKKMHGDLSKSNKKVINETVK